MAAPVNKNLSMCEVRVFDSLSEQDSATIRSCKGYDFKIVCNEPIYCAPSSGIRDVVVAVLRQNHSLVVTEEGPYAFKASSTNESCFACLDRVFRILNRGRFTLPQYVGAVRPNQNDQVEAVRFLSTKEFKCEVDGKGGEPIGAVVAVLPM